ncbi:DUF6599 family protein [Massilibacteroides vaginae]|uniref:DUF6599 family protein n=1 Tax=Massilibacteroides vaginae TaxID=1673718 RepID=UPI000A1CBBCE|nr:DUF6599 family protein [Massilibacteroides vaginae]
MNRLVYLLILFLTQSALLFAGQIEVKRERVFTGTGLYGFMNGGADLFLEYGVRKLTTRDILYAGEEYTLDIYEMPTPEDAYGIYSVHTFKCDQADTDGGINCLSTYQLQSVVGNCYVSLVFTSGSEKARSQADVVLKHYTSALKRADILFPEQLTISPPYSGVLKFMRGTIALSAAQLSLSNLLKDCAYTGVWLYPSANDDEKLAFISFETKEDALSLFEKAGEEAVLNSGENWILLKNSDLDSEEENYGPFGF